MNAPVPHGGPAVMSRRLEPRDSLDFFPTPAWGTRALCRALISHGHALENRTVWEPACGEGHMVRPLAEYFASVTATDVLDYGHGSVVDFLCADGFHPHDWIITNPPFKLAETFAHRGVERARKGVALLVRTAFLESVGRWRDLFSVKPPALVLQFTERLPMHKGRVDPTGSTATAYCWIVWTPGHFGPTEFAWLPPCRRALERPEDYAVPA